MHARDFVDARQDYSTEIFPRIDAIPLCRTFSWRNRCGAAPNAVTSPAAEFAASAEVGEPVSAAVVADVPAAGVESAVQPEVSAGEAAKPAVEAIAPAEAASSAPAAAPLAEAIVADLPAASVAIAEETAAAGDAPTPDASAEAPPPKTNGAAKSDAASAAPTAT